MVKLKRGIFGPVLGKIGGLVFSSWKGKNYAKKAAEPVKKGKKKQTPAQINAQRKLVYVTRFLGPFQPYITVGFMHMAEGQTEINAANSYNYHDAFSGVYPDFAPILPNFKISTGKLPMIKDIEIIKTSDDTVSLTWKKNAIKGTDWDDQLIMVLYSQELHEADGFIGGARRSQEKYTFTFGEEISGKLVHVYFSLASTNRKYIAESIYWGTIQL